MKVKLTGLKFVVVYNDHEDEWQAQAKFERKEVGWASGNTPGAAIRELLNVMADDSSLVLE